jgi:hypothetical protein
MGFNLSSLNPASLVGNAISNAAESICDAVLPKNLEFIGDLVGLAADVESGNWIKCLDDLQDLTKDLPQQLADLYGPKTLPGMGDALMVPTFLEPSPPPTVSGPTQPAPSLTDHPASSDSASAVQGPKTTSAAGQISKVTSPEGFFGLSDASLMNAVRAGTIPESVKNDPALMRRLEARMNDITEMNHLLTSMLKAIHDMNSQVIQNIRV